MTKKELKRAIYEYDFAMHELVLFLDSHPTNQKAMSLLSAHRIKRAELVKEYESKYGAFIVTTHDVPAGECWKWLKGPWPWENNFMED